MQVLAKTNTNNTIYAHAPSMYDANQTKSAVPPTGAPASIHMCDIIFSNDDIQKIEEYYLNFLIKTTDGTNYPIIINPYLLFSEFKYSINNQEKEGHNSTESIRCAVSNYLERFGSYDKFYSFLQRVRNNKARNLTGDSVTTSGIYYNLPLSVIFPELECMNTKSGIQRITFYWKFNADYASAALNGKFVSNATATNGWSTAITITDLYIRMGASRYLHPSHIAAYNGGFHLRHNYEIKQYSGISWNTADVDQQKISLHSDFSRHNKILGLTLFIYPDGLVTAYNDADACKMYSTAKYITWEIKYKSRVLLDMKHSTRDLMKRCDYSLITHQKRYGVPMLTSLLDESDDVGKLWINGLYIDLASVMNYDSENIEVIGGINNETNDLEINLYCGSAIHTSCTLYACLHYSSGYVVDKSTGLLKNVLS